MHRVGQLDDCPTPMIAAQLEGRVEDARSRRGLLALEGPRWLEERLALNLYVLRFPRGCCWQRSRRRR